MVTSHSERKVHQFQEMVNGHGHIQLSTHPGYRMMIVHFALVFLLVPVSVTPLSHHAEQQA